MSWSVAKFEERIEYEPNSGCWLWTGPTRAEYGRVYWRGTHQDAHRISFQLFRGQIPDKLNVLHRCDTPPCVNPDHLFLGTHAQNMRDMAQKKRSRPSGFSPAPRSGEYHFMAKLTLDQVAEIKRRCLDGEIQKRIAAEYGVCASTITNIVRGYNWRKGNAIGQPRDLRASSSPTRSSR